MASINRDCALISQTDLMTPESPSDPHNRPSDSFSSQQLINTTANITFQITKETDAINASAIIPNDTPDASSTPNSSVVVVSVAAAGADTTTSIATTSHSLNNNNGVTLGAKCDSDPVVTFVSTHRKSKSLRRHRGLRHIGHNTGTHSHSNGVGREEDEFNSKLKQFQQICNFNKRTFDPTTAIEMEQLNEQPSDSKRRKYTIGSDRSPLWTTLTHAQTITEYPES